MASTGLAPSSVWSGKIYSNGWRSSDAGSLGVTDKSTGEHLGEIGRASANGVASAALIAREAQRAWAALPGPHRGDIVRKASQLVLQHADEIAAQIVRETGSIRPKGRAEAALTAREILEAASLRFDHGERGPGQAQYCAADPCGRRRCHYALEFALPTGIARGCPGAGMRQRRSPEAGPSVSRLRRGFLRPTLRGCWPAAGPVAHSSGRRRGRRSSRERPACQHDQLHRLDQSGTFDRRHGRGAAEAGVARAWRQQCLHCTRRCRHRSGRQCRCLGFIFSPRPDLLHRRQTPGS
jgi:hypothetical protein